MVSNVFTSALSSMDRSKAEFGLASHNIANAQEKDYAKITLNVSPSVVNGQTQGVFISSVSVNVDEVMETKLLEKISRESYDSTVSKYLTEATDLFGKPGSTDGLDKRISNAFGALDNLSRSPSSASMKQIAVIELGNLADTISQVAMDMQKLRLTVDTEISSSLSQLNNDLADVQEVLATVYGTPRGSIENVTAQEKLRVSLEGVAEYFELYKYQDDVGNYKVYTSQGDSLIGDVNYFLKYDPQNSLDAMIRGDKLNPVLLSAHDGNGKDMHVDQSMVYGDYSENIKNRYTSGKIGALLELRDKLLPKTLGQLDNLAKNIKEEFNKIHNNGAGYPPPNKLTGTNLVTRDQVLGFDGKIRVSVVDDNGISVSTVPSLDLDLSALDTGRGAGKANLQGILQEINYHFGDKIAADKSIALGNLKDIKLVSTNKTIDPSSAFVLDLELDNYSGTSSTVSIQSVVATDNLGNNILGSFNNTSFVAPTGANTRTGTAGPSVSLNLPAAINYPFTVDMQVSVNDGTTTSTSTLRYTIGNKTPDDFNGLLNQRYSVVDKVNVLDPGTINNPVLVGPAMLASIVREDTSTISTNSVEPGLLKFEAQEGGMRIVIDSLDSSHKGDMANNIFATNFNFSYFFGLNDLFVRKDDATNWNNTKNTAVWLSVRDDIKNDSGYLSRGKLKAMINNTNPSQPTYQYEVTTGDNDSTLEMLDLTRKAVYFQSAGSMGAAEMSLSDYAGNIMSFSVNQTSVHNLRAAQSSVVRGAISDRLQNLRGVDVNEEMANLVVFQQSFGASAKALQAAIELMDILLESI